MLNFEKRDRHSRHECWFLVIILVNIQRGVLLAFGARQWTEIVRNYITWCTVVRGGTDCVLHANLQLVLLRCSDCVLMQRAIYLPGK